MRNDGGGGGGGDGSSNRPSLFPEEAEEEAAEEHDILSWAFALPPPPHDPFSLLAALPIRPPITPPPPQQQQASAFTEYRASTGENDGGRRPNVNRRLIRFLRFIATAARPAISDEAAAPASGRGFRHMMRERLRRERMSQGYADLHSVLPFRSRGDKISIVRSAMEYLKELRETKDDLRQRNRELQDLAAAHGRNAAGTSTAAVRVKAENRSASPLDSAIAALRSLKRMELDASGIRTEFAGGSSSVGVVFAGEVAREEVERELKAALVAAESQL